MKNLVKKFNSTFSGIFIGAFGLLLVGGGGGGCVSPTEEDLIINTDSNTEKVMENPSDELSKSLEKIKSGTSLILGIIGENPSFIEYLEAGTNLQFEGQHQILFTEIFNPESELNQNYKIKSKLQSGKLNPVFNLKKVEFEKILGDDLRLYWPYFEVYDSLDKNIALR